MAITSDMLSWNDGIGTGEISTVEGNGGFDKGYKTRLTVKSEKTGKSEDFLLYSNDYDKGELVSFTYMPENEDLKRKDIGIVLFND